MKYCPRCNTDKSDAEFYFNQKLKKLSSYCKICQRSHQKEWWEKNPDRKLEINREWTLRNHSRKQLMNSCSNAVQAALKAGLLIRPETCEACSGGGDIEAAHHDYSQPLNVRWLCTKCHRTWDSLNPKTSIPEKYRSE